MFTKRKKKLDKKRRSLFVDDFIKDHSLTQCTCELYVPEPSFKYDNFGAVKEICMSGDVENFLWSKHCTIHLCELPFVDQNFTFTLQDTGQDFEICLNITLNHQRKGDLVYLVRDEIWHECRQKNGTKWRTFVLRFDQDCHNYKEFLNELNTVLQTVESTKPSEKTYILVAVQGEKDKAQNPTNQRRFTLERDITKQSTSESSTILEDKTCNSGSDQSVHSEEETNQNTDDAFMEAPFDPAPFETAFTKTVRILKSFSQEFSRKENKTQDRVSDLMREISVHCDSFHINPNELPQTLESLLHSITRYSSDLDYTKYDPRSTDTLKDFKQIQTGAASKILSETNPRLLSEDIPSEGRYLPMGAEADDKMASGNKDNQKLANAQKLGELLATAINHKEQEHAGLYAKQLAADDGVTVKVIVDLKPGAAEDFDKEFNLKVFLEDRESSGGSIMLKVRSSDTIRDLKNRMLMKHMFPVEVQTWIIGQRIPVDTETLSQCKVKGEGHSVYLYLVSANSVGLNKADFLRRQNVHTHTSDYEIMEGFPAPQDPVQYAQPQVNPAPVVKKAGKQPQPNKTKPDKITPDNINKYDLKVAPEKLQGKQPTFTGPGHVQNPRSQNEGQMRLPTHDIPKGRQQKPQQILDILNQIKPDIAQAAHAAGIPPGLGRVPVMHPEESEEPSTGWSCGACTFINQPTRPGCEVCGDMRPKDYVIPADYIATDEELQRMRQEQEQERKTREAEERQRHEQEQESQRNYEFLQEADAQHVIPNTETFHCPICLDDIDPGQGAVLRECLHHFCRDCLHDHVQYSEEPVLKCPYQDDSYLCDGTIQDREIKALVSKEIYDKYLARSLTTAESQAANSFHCKTADCPGWCVYEDHVNFFLCPVCRHENCLTCKAIHQGLNCKQYQEDLKIRAMNDGAARETRMMIKKMVDDGDAMPCPQCQVIVMKKEGCDWIQCSICKTEICWVTKGPRWGPMGSGDISGGCKCRVNGVICHDACNNCH